MAEKKLLSAYFSTPSGEYAYNLGCQSSDSIPITEPQFSWKYSGDEPLNQVGCTFITPSSASKEATDIKQVALYDSFTKAGYGTRVGFLPNILVLNVPMYLNGAQSLNGVNMPWIQWEHNGYGNSDLIYYKSDGTRIGTLWKSVIGTQGGSHCSFIAGQIFDDGTFIGCAGPVKVHTILGVASHKYYEWFCSNIYTEPVQVIRPEIIEDLKEYLHSEPEGEFTDEGNGDYDSSSDPIDFPDLPAYSVLNTGLLTVYEMTTEQLRALSNYLWSTDFDIENFKKLFENPMESVVNLCMTPFDVTENPLTVNIKIGNITTPCKGQLITNQYKIINFGTIHLREYWANFGDYSPYTQLSIYLPYVGVQKISVDDVMNGSIQLKGYFDVLTGVIVYMLLSEQGNRRGHGHKSVLYTWSGNTQYQIPITATNMNSVITSLISTAGTIASGVGATVASGGLTAPMAVSTIGSAVGNVMSAKTHVQRSGGLGGAMGILAVQKPYLIIERPEQIAPENYNHTIGVPCEKTDYLKNYSGFVKIKGVDLKIDGATKNELLEIERLLKSGVYI